MNPMLYEQVAKSSAPKLANIPAPLTRAPEEDSRALGGPGERLPGARGLNPRLREIRVQARFGVRKVRAPVREMTIGIEGEGAVGQQSAAPSYLT